MKKLRVILFLIVLSLSSCQNKVTDSSTKDFGLADACNFDKIPNPNQIDFKHLARAVVQVDLGDGSATGFFFNSDGYILTNRHVVVDCLIDRTKCDAITVRTPVEIQCKNGVMKTRFQTFHFPKLVWPLQLPKKISIEGDLAILKVDPSEISWQRTPFISLSNKNHPSGDRVFSLGYPGQTDFDSVTEDINRSRRYLKHCQNWADVIDDALTSKNFDRLRQHVKYRQTLSNLSLDIQESVEAIRKKTASEHEEAKLKYLTYLKDSFKLLVNESVSFENKVEVATVLLSLYRWNSQDETLILQRLQNIQSLSQHQKWGLRPDGSLRVAFGKILDEAASDIQIFSEGEFEILETFNKGPATFNEALIEKLQKINQKSSFRESSSIFVNLALSMLLHLQQADRSTVIELFGTNYLFSSQFVKILSHSNDPDYDPNFIVLSDSESFPGSSGSPLLDEDANVVGLFSSRDRNDNYPYAPADFSLSVKTSAVRASLNEMNEWRKKQGLSYVKY